MATEAAVRPSSEVRIKAALWFADRGFGIFPVWSTDLDGTCRCPAGTRCTSPGKHPVTTNGFKDATQDPERIRLLLSAGSEPNYGMVNPEGVFALDVDGPDVARMDDLEARYGPLPPTLRTRTAHGRHIFLRWPEALPRPLGHLFGFVTRWGSGRDAGYVIGPRSVHASGAVYAPEGEAFDIATLPDVWAHAALEKPKAPITIKPGGPLDVGIGHRHEYLRNQARHLRGLGLEGDALYDAVSALNRQLAEPKDDESVRRAIGDVETRFGRDELDSRGRPLVSDQGDVPMVRKDLSVLFATAKDIMTMPDAAIGWAHAGYLAFGAITEIVGPPKAGKTTLVFDLIRALVDGQPFLDRTTAKTPVVVLTEQLPPTLRAVLERTHLATREDVHFLFHRDTRGETWPDVIAAAVARCTLAGARVLIVDTLPVFAGLSGESENNAGDALAAMVPLTDAASAGLAVLVNRHRRKGGAEDIADEGRGSGAFSGVVDVVVSLRRTGGQGRQTVRVLAAASRFDETPEELYVELAEGGYQAVGATSAVVSEQLRADVLAALGDDQLTMRELEERTSGKEPTLRRVLEDLIRTGHAERTGAGGRMDPYRYSSSSPRTHDDENSDDESTLIVIGSQPSRPGSRRHAGPPTGGAEAASMDDENARAATWLRPCRDYPAHQSSHRRTDAGWVCDACDAEDQA